MRIAMVSEHASPLAALGGVDAGGQNVHVAALAAALARRGARGRGPHPPRRPRPAASACRSPPASRCDHVDAGPAEPVPKDELLPYMGGVRRGAARRSGAPTPPDVVHAHFWMSGLAALDAARDLGVPGRADLPRARRRSSAATRARRTPARAEPDRARAQRRPPASTASSPPAPTRSSSSCGSGADRRRMTRRAVRRRPRALHARRAGEARGRPAAGSSCVGRLVERKGVGRRRSARSPTLPGRRAA